MPWLQAVLSVFVERFSLTFLRSYNIVSLMNKKIFSTLELINVKEIKEKIIILKGNKFAKILKVEPVNLSLKSNKEKN